MKKFTQGIEAIHEAESAQLSDLQKSYREYFSAKLTKFGAKSPADLTPEQKSEFFNEITKDWNKGQGSTKAGQADVEKHGVKESVKESVNESALSDIDLLAKDSKDFKDFIKNFKRDYKNLNTGNAKELEAWLKTIYDVAIDESLVNEGKEIKSESEFKEYAMMLLKKAHPDDFDEEKANATVEGILKKCDGDFGAAVGMITSSLGEAEHCSMCENDPCDCYITEGDAFYKVKRNINSDKINGRSGFTMDFFKANSPNDALAVSQKLDKQYGVDATSYGLLTTTPYTKEQAEKYYSSLNESTMSESTVLLDTTDPEDKVLLAFLKKHNIKMKDTSVRAGGDFAEVKYSGKRKDLEKMINGLWGDDYLLELIEESVNEAKGAWSLDSSGKPDMYRFSGKTFPAISYTNGIIYARDNNGKNVSASLKTDNISVAGIKSLLSGISMPHPTEKDMQEFISRI